MNKQEAEEFETNVVEICSKAALDAYKDFKAAGYELSGVELKRYGTPSNPNYQSELVLTIYQQADGKGNLMPVDWIEELICLDGVPRYTLDGIKEWIDEQLQNLVFTRDLSVAKDH